jgi:hypothetical protein
MPCNLDRERLWEGLAFHPLHSPDQTVAHADFCYSPSDDTFTVISHQPGYPGQPRITFDHCIPLRHDPSCDPSLVSTTGMNTVQPCPSYDLYSSLQCDAQSASTTPYVASHVIQISHQWRRQLAVASTLASTQACKQTLYRIIPCEHHARHQSKPRIWACPSLSLTEGIIT